MENKEKTLAQLDAARLKVKQYENKIQLLENRKQHLEKKADRQRTHHLCNMGGAIQSISKEADSLTRVEFYSLMEQIFALPAVQELVDAAMQNHELGGDSRWHCITSMWSRSSEARDELPLPVPPIVPVKCFIISGTVKPTITQKRAVSFCQKSFCRNTYRKDFMTDRRYGMKWSR